MNSWKLSVFFILGLILFTAGFSNTALAADGAGEAVVSWSDFTPTTPGMFHLGVADTSSEGRDFPLHPGTRQNRIKIIYTADAADNMGGGLVRVKLPGWPIPQISERSTHKNAHGLASKNRYRYVRITSEPTDGDRTILYQTRRYTLEDEVTKDNLAMVQTISEDMVEVKLSDDWKRGGTLRIRFGFIRPRVPTHLPLVQPVMETGGSTSYYPYANYQLTVSSRTKNGVFVALKKQPSVRVTNIRAYPDTYELDSLKREFTVEPATVYEGEKGRDFKITFTAPGPMYAVDNTSSPGLTDGEYPRIIINIPAGMRPAATSTINVLRTAGVVKFKTDTNTPGDKIARIEVFLDGLNKGQTVTVRYKADITTAVNKFEDNLGSIQIAMPVNKDPVNATKISGGVSRPIDGSGKVELTPTAVEAGSQRINLNLTYTAETDLKDRWLFIRPRGVVIDTTREDMRLQNTNSAGYGYVSGSMPGLGVEGPLNLIGYRIDDLDKIDSVTITIHRVDIVSEAREYPWEVFMGRGLFQNRQVESPPILSVTKTSGDAVKFEIVGDSTFPAGSEQTITFRFTAESTPIRDGNVSLTIPEALGSKPTITPETPGRVMVTISNGELEKDQDTKPGISNRTINVGVKRMDIGESITITYGSSADQGKPAVLSDVSGNVTVVGTFKTSASVSARRAGTVTVTIGNIVDGIGSVQIPVESRSVEAGSNHRMIEIEFTAAGTMDGGQVSLEMPSGWGSLQEDPTLRNYVTTRGSGVSALDISGGRVIATFGQFAKGDTFNFVIGGGTGGDNNGIEVQDSVGTTAFTVRSDGDGDNVFAPITSELEHTGREQLRNPKALGKIYKSSANEDITVGAGVLRIEVISALDGTGTATVDKTEVRAAADDVALEFTYTPSQTIENGEMQFTVPSSWSKPQVKEPGLPGYTEVVGIGFGTVTVNDKFSVIFPIFSLYKGQTITIKYGATATGRAMASTVVGTDIFKFEIKGHADGTLTPLRTQPTVMVGPQANGKGTAVLAITDDGGDLHAGDMGREITITYTAAGQIVAGDVVLGIPTKWSAPTVDNLMVTPDITPTIDGQMATVSGVNLMAGGRVTLVYTGDVQPTTGTGVAFSVKVSGGAEGDVPAAVSGEETMLTVDVGQARAGAGMGAVSPRIVQAGATGVNLQFTYTAVGWTDAPREFRVQVPRGWTAPSNAVSSSDNKGTYTVKHRSGGAVTLTSVEKLDPIGRDMTARVRWGSHEVIAGDEIIFTYENADAPTTPEVSNFVMIFDGKPIAGSVQVRVQDSMPSALSLESAGTVSADEGAPPLGITVGLRDADGNTVAMENDVAVTLTSSSTTGAFAMIAGEVTGTESDTVTIAGGDVSTIIYYTDSTAGTATITATASGLTTASQEVTVTAAAVAPDAVEITSVTVSPTLAKDGNTVTVTAMATSGQAPMVTIGTLVTDGAMIESPAGTYTRTDTLTAGTQEGTYTVSVHIGDVMMSASDMLTVDNTAPMVTVTAPERAENGDTVMISATVTEVGTVSSVMAEVSALDSTQTDVALTLAADGSYSASITISADNTAANGAKTITVTAMDAAGNSGMGTVTVKLANMLSYTSTIPVGMVLFHVPLDVDGLDTVGDLKATLGDAVSIATVYDTAAGSWNNESDNVVITADLGILLLTTAEITHTFEGQPWDGGASTINLQAGSNFIGLSVDDPRITNVSDIITVAAGAIVSIIVATDDRFALVAAAGDPGDGPVMGDAAYLVTATSATTIPLLGDGWSNDGVQTITVTAVEAAGNNGVGTATVELANMLSYTSMIPVGQSLFHVPLEVEGLDSVGDLKTALGDSVSIAAVYDPTLPDSWNSKSDDVAITADLGILLLTTAEITHTFKGQPWGGGLSTINLQVGANFIGLPVDDPRITNVSDIITVAAGVITSIGVLTDDRFALVAAAGDPGDGPVMGDAAYLVTATSATTIPLLGEGWSYGMTGAAPIALTGYNVDGQTAVLDVNGAVVDEITGLAREGFRVKVKNLSTKASLSKVTSVETAAGYNMTFVDLRAGHAARIGDVLEISADSPSPLIGVQPVRHVVTADDVKSGILALEDLIAYEIPAETELLRNYPNPFNPETWIPYRLAEDADVSLTIYDVNGALVRTIDMGHQSAAVYESRAKAIYWDGRNRFGEGVASGVYFYSLSAGDFSATRKMVILK